jgi:transposase
VRDDADFVLIFQDEMEIHRHPALTRMWARVGQQPEVPAPGKNEKKVVYGGVDYRTGQLTYTVADSKCGSSFLAFLVTLLLAYAGTKIRLVCDNGRFHTTKAVQAFLEEHREQIEVYWLPPYSPSLNLIERLWGHMKRTVLANVLYATLRDLVAAFRKGARRLTGDRERMGFMFDHDDLAQKSPRNHPKIAA